MNKDVSKKRTSIRFALLGLTAMLFLAACDDGVQTTLKTPVYNTGLPDNEMQNAPLAKIFPKQYASYELNNEDEKMTVYKGSVEYHKNDGTNPLPEGYKYAQPYLKNLWLGYPFMYEYNESRGHTYAVHDLLYIDRLDRYRIDGKAGLPATCWNCKTPQVENWHKEYGDAFWSMDANFFREKINQADVTEESVSCGTCHNTTNMEQDLYSYPLKQWLERSGQDYEKMSRNDQRSLACAQCHVEYYFTHPSNGVAATPVFPWDKGFDPAQIYSYYNEHGPNNGKFVDFKHAASGVDIIKVQHPEYETWINGTHGSAGVSCADCHMPYEQADGKKYSSHWWTSPLKDPNLTACRQCHSDKSAQYLKERVIYTQEKTYTQLIKAQEASVRAHEAVRLANNYQGDKNVNYDLLMNEARELTRKGQFFWDYVSAEGSVGFHNPQKALDTLMSSYEYSTEAVNLAVEATNGAIIQQISGNIYEIVPPILEFSRKLQQSQEVLDSNPWLKLLPLMPERPLEWDGIKRLHPQVQGVSSDVTETSAAQ